MIPVSLTTLIILGVAAGVGLFAIFWIMAVLQERRSDKRTRQDLIQCRICGTIFENPERAKIASCPGCGSLNEAIRPSPI